MSQFWSNIVNQLTPYTPGEQPQTEHLIKLNTNENPYPPSQRVIKAIQTAVGNELRLYPDPQARQLKQLLADFYHLQPSQIFVGNGSDEVLAHTFQGLLQHHRKLLFPDITYSFYPAYCALYNISYQKIPLREDFSLHLDDYQQPNGGIIFPNPNAPTGKLIALADIEQLLQRNSKSVVVVDEAYIDFDSHSQSAAALVNQFPNLLIVQTFSKYRSLAGLRVGYAMGHVDLITALERVKNSFNSYPLDRLALAGAMAAIEDNDYFQLICKKIIATRNRITVQLNQLGFETLNSAANFVMARHKSYAATELNQILRQKGILVRYFETPRINQFIRISIGTDEEMDRFIEELTAIIQSID